MFSEKREELIIMVTPYKSKFSEAYPDRDTMINIVVGKISNALAEKAEELFGHILGSNRPVYDDGQQEEASELFEIEEMDRDDLGKFRKFELKFNVETGYDEDEDEYEFDWETTEPRRLAKATKVMEEIANSEGFTFRWFSGRNSIFYLT